jgi:hypothetical protein
MLPRFELMLIERETWPKKAAGDEVRSLIRYSELVAGLTNRQPRALVWRNWFDQWLSKKLPILK